MSAQDLNQMQAESFSLLNQDHAAINAAVFFAPTKVTFMNPFTGEMEDYLSERDANNKMLAAAANRINDLQAEIDAIKAKAQVDTAGVLVTADSAAITFEDCYALTTGK